MWFRLLCRLFLALTLTLVLGAVPLTPAQDPLGINRVFDSFSVFGMKYTWHWEECGGVNAYYEPRTRSITLCSELVDHMTPGQIRFILAHELSHGVVAQLGLAIPGSEEIAADMLAAWVLGMNGMDHDTLEMAVFFYTRARPDSNPSDPHPGDVRRGMYLYCLGKREKGPSWCGDTWVHNQWVWPQLIGPKL